MLTLFGRFHLPNIMRNPFRARNSRPSFTPSKLPSSFASSSRDKQGPVIIKFPQGFKSGDLYNWCIGLSGRSRSVKSLQIRKDVGGPVPHRFVILRMYDGKIHRFDRRPEQRTPEHVPAHTKMDLLRNKAVPGEDSYIENVEPKLFQEDIQSLSNCEIELFFNEGQLDLLVVVSACFGISEGATEKYTFLKHNCFFFSWSILMVVSRHCLPYDIPMLDPLMEIFNKKLDHLVSFIVDEAIELFLKFMIDTIMVIVDELGEVIPKEIIPKQFVRFLWRHIAVILGKQLHVRDRLQEQTRKEIGEKVLPVYESILGTGTLHDTLNQHLWIEESSTTIDTYIGNAVQLWKWEAIIAIISSAFQDGFESGPIQLQSSILGTGFAQLTLGCRTALPAGMTAVQGSVATLDGTEQDGDVFDMCWAAAREATLTSVRSAVEATFPRVNSRWQEAIWVKVWEVWDGCWEKAREVARPNCLLAIKKCVDEIVKTGTATTLVAIRKQADTLKAKLVKVRLRADYNWLPSSDSGFKETDENSIPKSETEKSMMTNASLQDYMQSCIKSYAIRHKTFKEVNESMSEIWGQARIAMQSVTPDDLLANGGVSVDLAASA